ncbi:hypothetical protein [Solobacterium moorei]|uniref:hypothetical protein n=1 Tax=Solobacterium moorei TaxID=102148 RepID=UPI00040EE641|nr:hypothetical protein [Solobacterium moorei]BET21099.1 hypothetical protein RGT18_06870 [Solobacterium moorei]
MSAGVSQGNIECNDGVCYRGELALYKGDYCFKVLESSVDLLDFQQYLDES